MSNDSNPTHVPPPPQIQPPRSNTGLIVIIVAAVVAIPVLLACVGVLIGLLLPAVQAAREAARRMECSNNMKQIALALHNYESKYQSFPPVYTTDSNGQPLHSWRTLILPFMEQGAVYSQIDLSLPWDDPANQFLAGTAISEYSCPSAAVEPTRTTYMAVVHPAGIFSGAQGVKFSQITDGTSNTLLVVETDPSLAVPWYQPQDTDLPTVLSSMASGDSSRHTGGFNVSMADGSVRFLTDEIDGGTLEAIVTKDQGEPVGL